MILASQKKQAGFAALFAVVIIVIFSFLSVIALYSTNSALLESSNQLFASQALFCAESGLEYATRNLVGVSFSNLVACENITGNSNFTNASFSGAAGTFTVSASKQSPNLASVLNGALSATTTVIPIVDASGYPASGRIMIDRELIDYANKIGNTLIQAARGAGGSIATSHASGAGVGQYQCVLNASGGVPTLTAPHGKRTLQEAIQLQEAWAASNNSGSTIPMLHWNKPQSLQWAIDGIASYNRDMYAVSMLSYADVWTVGQNGNIFHYNGNAWSSVPSPDNSALNGIACVASNACFAVGKSRSFIVWNGTSWSSQSVSSLPKVAYNGIYCNTANDCWAVGNRSGGVDVMVHWDGSSWSRDPSDPTASNNLTSVACTATNDCWAVGNSKHFIHWNGSNWTTISTAAITDADYNSVSCVNANDCLAVGNSGTAAHWNGSSWANVSSTTSAALNGVACLASNDCLAVGNSGTTIHWDGTNWANITNPASANLNAVAMVGYNTNPKSAWQELAP